jgi:hypothetical protein
MRSGTIPAQNANRQQPGIGHGRSRNSTLTGQCYLLMNGLFSFMEFRIFDSVLIFGLKS